MKGRLVRYAILTAGIVLIVISGYGSMESRNDFQRYKQLSHSWADLKRLDVQLNEHMLLVRLLMERNYDALMHDANQIKKIKEKLKHHEHDWGEVGDDVKELFALLKQKFALIEQYKGDHAILQNSHRYLPIITLELNRELEGADRVRLHDLISDVYFYISIPSVERRAHIEAMVKVLRQSNHIPRQATDKLENMFTHVSVVLDKAERLAALGNTILQLPTRIN